MDALYYYSTSKITLTDIQSCVSKAGYKTGFQLDPVDPDKIVEALYIACQPTRAPEYTLYWRWQNSNAKKEGIDPESWKIISSVWSEIQTMFVIWYSMMDMEDFGQMMREVMICYGGYVAFEYKLFHVDNILSIQEYVLPPPTD